MMAYASLQALGPSGFGSKKIFPIPRISNGVLYIEGYGSLQLQDKNRTLQPADWLVVDPITGWAQVIPDSVFTAASSVWNHS
jgi:hypothetical protein